MGLINFPFLNGKTIITLDQFLTNPTGRGSSMMAKREFIKKDLDRRYSVLLKNSKTGKFWYQVFIDKNTYFFYFKIPSETYKEIMYDVVLEFVPMDKKVEKFSTINDYAINFYSNSPHMMFTYTYVLNENNILVNMLNIKYSKEALKNRPKVTNPVEIFGFEKSCYYAAKYIMDNKLYNKFEIEKKATPISKTTRADLLNSIMSQESKYLQYEAVKKKYADIKRKEKAKAKVKKANSEHSKAMATYKAKKGNTAKKTSGFKSVFSKKSK